MTLMSLLGNAMQPSSVRKRQKYTGKLTAEDAKKIREILATGATQSNVAERYNVSIRAITNINLNVKFHDPDWMPVQRRKVNFSKLDKDDVIDIRRRYARGDTQVSIARKYRVCNRTISDIVHRRAWDHKDI